MEIFLHHYPPSLFSEKIRLLLGYLELPWRSVIIPSIMPRPLLMPLSGGYRKTPVLQIGANVYCDSRIIARGLARHAGNTSLYAQGFAAIGLIRISSR
jgi:glutathione S-transferase